MSRSRPVEIRGYNLPSWITVRPIERWPGKRMGGRQCSRFGASPSQTYELLERELRQLDAKRVVLQVAIREEDLKLNGQPRAQARTEHPGVILAFDSKHGPLQYATDLYGSWQENLRAVALSLEALRKVDRYGVSSSGEQYRGWRAIPASTDQADAIQTAEQARAVLEPFGGDWKAAARTAHPDRGGDPGLFRQIMRAKEILER